ncbi:ABC transporter substrate-binding protein [Marinactinospora thermotolerans]|uniref:Amino acid/amide ABC transporter substrate-binding protein, HAAT family n=1 Tax=Marinactinospora thermotolerans DSM 45154 TaxID=1122192 RepID=A0A1T4KQF0_9ACTN|nr:ABC transporter substrate-binding protein [Marinactinospora thermotolerans]SJZ44632.1 amino acid/amide ABC transporter substrate-binding protein, HAAT family [Marinactinospora thermotolerans DSM 45154]
MPSKKALGLTAAVAALALGLSACGGGGESGGGEGGEADALRFGYIFPETGDLSHLGPPQISAAKYALHEINEAGGVLGQEVPEILTGDEANDAAQANDAADRLLGQDVDAVLGAAASGMTMAVIDRITGAEVVQCSGSNTSPDLSTYEDGGYYFRTAPSDLLQGPILGQKVVDDGHQSVAVVYRADDYGQGLAEATATALEENGAEVVLNEGYDPNSTNFTSVVQQVAGSGADAAVLVSFEEGVQIITGLIEEGFSPEQMYSADGLNNEGLGELVNADDPGAIAGFQGTAPGVDNEQFTTALTEFDSELEVFQYAPQVYDCAIVIALAAEAAESTDPTVFVEQMTAVTQGDTQCSGFAECRDLLAEGQSIDYQGASGPLDFDENGDVTVASFMIYGFDEEGTHQALEYVESKP